MAKTAVAKTTENQFPAALLGHLDEYAGKGVSTDAADNLVPLVYVLQAQSPQCLKRGDNYIEGAEAGFIWLRNADNPVINGEDGLLFQPCAFWKDVVEWIPRGENGGGGGYVQAHKYQAGEDLEHLAKRLGAKQVQDPKKPERYSWIMENGHELIETRYHAGYAIREDGTALAYVIPLSGSGHTFSREWMFKIGQKRLPSGKAAASWSNIYKLTTRFRTNADGDWFMLAVDNGHWVTTAEELDRGLALYQAFETGAKTADAPIVEQSEEPVAKAAQAKKDGKVI